MRSKSNNVEVGVRVVVQSFLEQSQMKDSTLPIKRSIRVLSTEQPAYLHDLAYRLSAHCNRFVVADWLCHTIAKFILVMF